MLQDLLSPPAWKWSRIELQYMLLRSDVFAFGWKLQILERRCLWELSIPEERGFMQGSGQPFAPRYVLLLLWRSQCFSLGLRMVILLEGIMKSVRWMSLVRCSRNFAPNGLWMPELKCLNVIESFHSPGLWCKVSSGLAKSFVLCGWHFSQNAFAVVSGWKLLCTHCADWLKASWSAWCTKSFCSWSWFCF